MPYELIVVLSLVGVVYSLHQTVTGWRTGKIEFRSLKGDRDASPITYWWLMATYAAVVFGALFAQFSIYGEPIIR